jgi:hypothetical protein
MRLAFTMDEMPYPAVTSTRKPASTIIMGDVVAAWRHILNAPAPAIKRKINPRNSCQSECNGLTAAGTTCLTNVPELRTAGAHCLPASRAIFPATRPAARIWSLSTVLFYPEPVINNVLVADLFRLYNQENRALNFGQRLAPKLHLSQ